jgi:hypothetical protein
MEDQSGKSAIGKIREASRLLKEARKELAESGFYLRWNTHIEPFRERKLPSDLLDIINKGDPIDSVHL